MRTWGFDAAEPIVTEPDASHLYLQDVRRRVRAGHGPRPRHSPIIMGSLLAIAAIGAALLYFGARGEPLAGAGRRPGAGLARTAATAPSVVDDAAAWAGTMLEVTGERLKEGGAGARRTARDNQ